MKCKACGYVSATSVKICPHCGKKYPMAKLVKISLVIIALIAFSAPFVDNFFPQNREPSPKDIAMNQINVDVKWDSGIFGAQMIADFIITNPSDYPVKDITIKCTHYAKSGTEIDSNTRTIYDIVPAQGRTVIKNFDMGFIQSQVDSSSCRCTNLKIAL